MLGFGVAPRQSFLWLAPKAQHLQLQAWGNAPGFVKRRKPPALKARFTSDAVSVGIESHPQD